MVRDMTTGNSAKQILKFSLPLLIGTVFQQFYNMVDSIIVGKFLGTQPFAAVGMTGSITFFVLGLVFGACSGFAIQWRRTSARTTKPACAAAWPTSSTSA